MRFSPGFFDNDSGRRKRASQASGFPGKREDADRRLIALTPTNGSRSPIHPAHAAEKSSKRQEKIKPGRKPPRGHSSHTWRSVRASAAKRTRIRKKAMRSLPPIAEALSRRFAT
jgi:hypothetical protein